MKNMIEHISVCNLTNQPETIEFVAGINKCVAGNIVIDICGIHDCSANKRNAVANVCEQCNVLSDFIKTNNATH